MHAASTLANQHKAIQDSSSVQTLISQKATTYIIYFRVWLRTRLAFIFTPMTQREQLNFTLLRVTHNIINRIFMLLAGERAGIEPCGLYTRGGYRLTYCYFGFADVRRCTEIKSALCSLIIFDEFLAKLFAQQFLFWMLGAYILLRVRARWLSALRNSRWFSLPPFPINHHAKRWFFTSWFYFIWWYCVRAQRVYYSSRIVWFIKAACEKLI